LFLPVIVALKTKMVTDYLWNGTDRGRPKYSEPEIDVNYISEFKVCLKVYKLILHYKDQPCNAE
jgi:hypothetical protein